MKCKFCGIEIEWEGHDYTHGHIWQCEECEEYVCLKCIEDAGGSVGEEQESILCPDCK